MSRPYKLILIVLACAPIIALLAAIITSNIYWGYYFRRPAVDQRIVNVDRIISITPVEVNDPNLRTPEFIVEPQYSLGGIFGRKIDGSIHSLVEAGRADEYYCLTERVLVALDDAELLSDPHPTLGDQEVSSLYALVSSTGVLVTSAEHLSGIVVETVDHHEHSLLFLGLTGGAVSNDHYPYYEFLFERRSNGVTELLSYNRFFFDVAGMEGTEWGTFFLVYLMPTSVVAALIILAVLGVALARRHRSRSRTLHEMQL